MLPVKMLLFSDLNLFSSTIIALVINGIVHNNLGDAYGNKKIGKEREKADSEYNCIMAAYAAVQNDICLINFHSKVARNNN